MKIKKRKPLVYGAALAFAFSFSVADIVLAEEVNSTAQTEKAQEANESAKENSKQQVSATQQSEDIPVAEIEIKAGKAQEQKHEQLAIGQQADAEGVNNYVVTHTSTGSKTDIATKDLPQTVSVVSQKVMEEQRPKTVEQALGNVAGISNGGGIMNPYANLLPMFNIRGFRANYFYVDGLYDNSSTAAGWLGNLDRIEVLKGPTSVLYGNNTPSGIINYITKKPLAYESYTIGQEFGSWGTRTTDLDMSIPLTTDKKWLSRTIIETDDTAAFQAGVNNKHFNGSVIVQGQPQEDTKYTFAATYNHYDVAGGYIGSLPTTGTIAPPYGIVPYDANYYNPNVRSTFIGRSVSGRVDHKLNDSWTISSALHYSESDYHQKYVGAESFTDNTYTNITQDYIHAFRKTNTLSWDTTGNAKFKALGLNHNLVLGYEWSRYKLAWPYSTQIWDYSSVVVTNPIWVDPPATDPASTSSHYSLYRHGVYLSDTLELSPKVKATAGIGHASYSYSTGTESSGTTWRLGTTYEASQGVTWFAGYSTAFEPNSAQTVTGTLLNFSPRTGNQLEGGVKVEVGSKASITMAAYKIKYNDILYNLGTNSNPDYQLIGEQTSKGVEIDVNYVIKPGWNLLAVYGQNNARITNDKNKALVGNLLTGVPNRTFRLWTTYEIQDGPRKGLGFGGGITYVGNRAFNSTNTLWLGNYSTIDGIIYYKTKDWRYSLNAYNLTDKHYWVDATGVSVYAGQPRSFIFRIEKTFS
ncbi:Metal-pseudopaline receptor CntO [Sporomusa silvacetica DSM 10669]|uniref:Metal-pseudopaline receptor CntO n=1 Tax=Sporomusa silvacetica DSM 10669 TaxID=1123289 RepID=A0ABZ3IH06_9FIRM|nr:TonB-dependent siderophore receptor [Sporomusa silvacetica]OZC14808.1 ferrichrome-iron receptor precursor [Sporomusa silvacetica DSM 10669]